MNPSFKYHGGVFIVYSSWIVASLHFANTRQINETKFMEKDVRKHSSNTLSSQCVTSQSLKTHPNPACLQVTQLFNTATQLKYHIRKLHIREDMPPWRDKETLFAVYAPSRLPPASVFKERKASDTNDREKDSDKKGGGDEKGDSDISLLMAGSLSPCMYVPQRIWNKPKHAGYGDVPEANVVAEYSVRSMKKCGSD